MAIDLDKCLCNSKQPNLICFFCWKKGIRMVDRLKEKKD